MKKREEVLRPDSCLNKADPDETLFVLRSKDKAAPATIRAWVRERVRLGLNKLTDDKIIEALHCASQMQAERESRGSIFPRQITRSDGGLSRRF